MNNPFQDASALAAGIGVTAAIATSALVWIAIVRKTLRGDPVVRYEGRRPVPWKTIDVAVIFGLYFMPMLVGLAASALQVPSDGESDAVPEISQSQATEAANGEETDIQHATMDLLRQDGTLLTWALCIVAAVVVAPVAEEFLFRLVLQGWLESAEYRRRRQGMRGLAPGAKPILISSLLFAATHFRLAEPAADPDRLRMMFFVQVCWSLMAVVYAVAWLRFRTPDLTAADLGIDPRRIKSDIRLGLSALLVVACPIYFLQFVLTLLWPNVVPDPISLFFFALALGFLYYRTHRLLPSIVLHMALNGTSLMMVWMFLHG